MTDPKRIAGIVNVTWNGNVINVVGNISWNLGQNKREGLAGPDRVHGYKENVQIPFIEGEGRIVSGMSVKEFVNITNATVTAVLATGKIVMITDAWYEGEGTAGTEEATLPFKFCGETGDEIG